jgi:choline-sulfatase
VVDARCIRRINDYYHSAGNYYFVKYVKYVNFGLGNHSDVGVVPQLFNLTADPEETTNLAGDPRVAEVLAHFQTLAKARWDLAAYDAEVRQSQARRWVVYEALRNGACYPWDHQPLKLASERYMRNHMDLNVLEENKRFPRGE